MNFKKSFQMSPEMRTILPSTNNKKPAKNFLVENIKNLREMQQQMEAARCALEEKAKKAQKSPKKKTPFTMKKLYDKNKWVPLTYSEDDLGDRITDTRSQGSTAGTAVLSVKQYSDQGVQTSPPTPRRELSEKALSVSPTSSRISSEPSRRTMQDETSSNIKERAINKMLKNHGVNYVELNRRTVDSRRQVREKPNPANIPPNYQLGVLPRYLKEKKNTNAQDSKKNDQQPVGSNQESSIKGTSALERPGHILLTDEERLEHLKVMKKCYEELLVQFNQLPIRNDSLKAKQKRADLEKQLENLENSMKIFSRERLYIKL